MINRLMIPPYRISGRKRYRVQLLSHMGQKIVVLRYLAIAMVVAIAFASDKIGQATVIRINPKTMSSGK